MEGRVLNPALVLGAVGSLAGFAFLVWKLIGARSSAASDAPESSSASDAASSSSTPAPADYTLPQSGRVIGLERLVGVDPRLWAFYSWWDTSGPFILRIPTDAEARAAGAAPAVFRSSDADQAAAAAAGTSKATTVKLTPHGRWQAVDAWVDGFNPHIAWAQQPQDIKDKFAEYGRLGKEHGLVHGGEPAFRSAGFPDGDQPHMQTPDWTSMSFPGPPGGYPNFA